MRLLQTDNRFTKSKKRIKMAQDFLPLLGTDHIEFWVGNAKQAAYYYQSALGFNIVGYCGPETGCKEKVSYLLRQPYL